MMGLFGALRNNHDIWEKYLVMIQLRISNLDLRPVIRLDL